MITFRPNPIGLGIFQSQSPTTCGTQFAFVDYRQTSAYLEGCRAILSGEKNRGLLSELRETIGPVVDELVRTGRQSDALAFNPTGYPFYLFRNGGPSGVLEASLSAGGIPTQANPTSNQPVLEAASRTRSGFRSSDGSRKTKGVTVKKSTTRKMDNKEIGHLESLAKGGDRAALTQLIETASIYAGVAPIHALDHLAEAGNWKAKDALKTLNPSKLVHRLGAEHGTLGHLLLTALVYLTKRGNSAAKTALGELKNHPVVLDIARSVETGESVPGSPNFWILCNLATAGNIAARTALMTACDNIDASAPAKQPLKVESKPEKPIIEPDKVEKMGTEGSLLPSLITYAEEHPVLTMPVNQILETLATERNVTAIRAWKRWTETNPEVAFFWNAWVEGLDDDTVDELNKLGVYVRTE